jgi:hypothetical protein
MIMLLEQVHKVSPEHANLLVGTIGDVTPGYAAGTIFHRGFQRPSYITLQISIPKALKRTGKPYQP